MHHNPVHGEGITSNSHSRIYIKGIITVCGGEIYWSMVVFLPLESKILFGPDPYKVAALVNTIWRRHFAWDHDRQRLYQRV